MVRMRYRAPKAGALPGCATPRQETLIDYKAFANVDGAPRGQFDLNCARTVPELCQNDLIEPSLCQNYRAVLSGISFAWRLIFSRASLFICNFICEYRLKT